MIGECIPIIEALSLKLIELQNHFPLNTTFKSTKFDDLPALLNAFPPRTGDNPATGFILKCTNRAHIKLSEYYGLTDELTWFITGMIMNPIIKWKWCRVYWSDKPGWLKQAQGNMRRLWKSYKPTQSTLALSRKRQLPN